MHRERNGGAGSEVIDIDGSLQYISRSTLVHGSSFPVVRISKNNGFDCCPMDAAPFEYSPHTEGPAAGMQEHHLSLKS
jgi:hypothetical protein